MNTPNITLVYLELLNPELVFGYPNTDSLESVYILSSLYTHDTVRSQGLRVKQRRSQVWSGT